MSIPVTSREYNVIVKPERLASPDVEVLGSIPAFWKSFSEVVADHVLDISGKLDKRTDDRHICFFDTPERALIHEFHVKRRYGSTTRTASPMKFKTLHLCQLLVTFLLMSASSLDAGGSVASKAGHKHPLARTTGAKPWPDASAPGVPAGLIWRSEGRSRGVLLCLHGIQTHAAWFGPLARELRNDGWTVIAPDRRGSGVNAAPPFHRGHTSGAKELLRDLDEHMELARKEAGGRPLLLVGTSWGSNLAGAWLAHTSRPLPEGFVELVPSTRSHFDPGPVKRLLVGTMNLVAKEKTKKVPFATRDYLPAGQSPSSSLPSWKALETDGPVCKGGNGVLLAEPTFGTLQAGLTLNRRARRLLAQGLPVPTLVIQATGDQIMKNDASWSAVAKSDRESALATRVLLEGGHGIQLDDPKIVADSILKWWRAKRNEGAPPSEDQSP